MLRFRSVAGGLALIVATGLPVSATTAGSHHVSVKPAPRPHSAAVPAPRASSHHRPAAEASLAGDGPVVRHANAFTADAAGLRPGQIEMTTVSTRPNLVTGHAARLAIRGLGAHDRLHVTVDGRDVTRAFHHVAGRPGQQPGVVEGLVRRLHLGGNDVTASATSHRYGRRVVHLRLHVHSLQGPIISGPHQEPFVCGTAGSGLGPAKGNDCLAPRRVHWWYEDLLGNFHRLANPGGAYPTGAMTTMVHGRRVPVIVRVETVVINRSITRLAVLADPHATHAVRGGVFHDPAWNHSLVYHFGESCGTGYSQGGDDGEISVFSPLSEIGGENITGPLLNLPTLLAHGFMVGQSSLTVFGVHCNQVLSAETLMMIKEHIVDRYGDVFHVIGGGASGGAIQQYTTANGYPGVLDAGTPLLSFPDVVTTAMTVGDCVLMKHFFQTHSGWNVIKQQAVSGLATSQVCNDWNSLFGGNLKPTSCPGAIPPSEVYNRRTNPHGVRCDLQDDLKNVLGTNPRTGRAYRPLDNVGVQYGLRALRRGEITPAEFVQLNRDIGGVNLDGGFMSRRESMGRWEARRMFAVGGVGEFGAINQTPIIDQTIPVSDVVPELDIHDQIRPYEIRARLNANFGNHRSQAIWSGVTYPAAAIPVANQWLSDLDRLQRAHPFRSRAWLVAHSRPAAAADSCRAGSLELPLVSCSVAKHAGPRQVAGGPLAEDTIKCRLRPVRRSDYPKSLTAAQLHALRRIFPTGVCDYAKHSVGYRSHSRTWLSFGGKRLYRHPVTVPYVLVRSRVPTRR
ncbi:MAG TPA: DUF6351 family protein [Mycobacteriales bacterium]|nr:DUF6351 family protein [Mycobacteriales bacterium]